MVMSSNNTLAYGFRIRFYAHIVPCFQQCLYVSDLHVLYFNSLFQLSYIIAIFTHFYAENYHVHCKSFSVKIVFKWRVRLQVLLRRELNILVCPLFVHFIYLWNCNRYAFATFQYYTDVDSYTVNKWRCCIICQTNEDKEQRAFTYYHIRMIFECSKH